MGVERQGRQGLGSAKRWKGLTERGYRSFAVLLAAMSRIDLPVALILRQGPVVGFRQPQAILFLGQGKARGD